MGLLYPGIDHLRDYLNRVGCQNPETKKILLDCMNWSNLDYTTVKGLENIIVDFEIRKQQLVLFNVPRNLERYFANTKITYCTDLEELRNFLLATK